MYKRQHIKKGGIRMNTNQKKEKYYDIVNGPNKDALFDACKYACIKNAFIPVTFDIAIGYTMPKSNPNCAYFPMDVKDFRVMGIENEDGSGESFNIHGYAKKDGIQVRFKGYYNTKQRNGVMHFES